MAGRISNVTYVSSYPPAQCGIATFVRDLAQSVLEEAGVAYQVVASADSRDETANPPEVWFEVDRDRLESYREAARFINGLSTDLVCLQHEFGLFGGPAGAHLIHLLRGIERPVLTTLHTVLRQPPNEYRRSLSEVAACSHRLVVMSRVAARILRETYDVSGDKIEVIYHGVPDVPFSDPAPFKRRLGLGDRFVLLTFGLLSPNKGIENMIDALPPVVREHPEVLYVVLGATHPGVRRTSGEAYRDLLESKVRGLGLEGNVAFVPRYVSNAELFEHILACDIYVTPYPGEEQVVSGTLSYAMGMGRAIVSTPYLYAREVLSDGRGVLVPFNDPAALSRSLMSLIEDPAKRERIRSGAYGFARKMVWKEVARKYVEAFERAVEACEVAGRRSVRRAAEYGGLAGWD